MIFLVMAIKRISNTLASNAVASPQKKTAFLTSFGLSAAAIAYGFEDCFFQLDAVNACVATAQSLIGPFEDLGSHMVAWATGILKAAFA